MKRADLGLFRSFGDSWYCVPPILIVAFWGPHHPTASAWPIYLAAFAAQGIGDLLASSLRCTLMYGAPLRDRLLHDKWPYLIDAMLVPIGLAAAFVAGSAPAAALASVLGIVGVLGMLAREQSQRREHQHRASHDTLTGLPNRHHFSDRLQQAGVSCADRRTTGAVLLVDLDDFKAINDTYGHACGDAALRGFAQRLCACVRPSDTVARLGGDEFAVLLSAPSSAADAVMLAARIHEAFVSPVMTECGELALSASIGAAEFGSQMPPSQALAQADAAMYQQKRTQRRQETGASRAQSLMYGAGEAPTSSV